MRFPDVIVLAASFGDRADRGASARLDRALRRLLALGRRPIVVIGPEGDEVLIKCTAVEECELAFDPECGGPGPAFSSVKLGLESAAGPALVVEWSKLEDEIPFFSALEEFAFANSQADAAGFASDSTGKAAEPGAGVWAIGLAGARRIKSLPSLGVWPEPSVIRMVYASRTDAGASADAGPANSHDDAAGSGGRTAS